MEIDKPINVSMTELRRNLKKYLDLVDKGYEVTIIRDSIILGKIVPDEAIRAAAEKKEKQEKEHFHDLPDGRQVRIRQLRLYEDTEKIRQLFVDTLDLNAAYQEGGPFMDLDLRGPAVYYPDFGGEFWIGEIDGELVAMGAFKRLDFDQADTAEIKRMRVKPGLQGQGIGRRMLSLMEDQARQAGYTETVLDTTDAEGRAAARHLYESHGYQEYDRRPRDDLNAIFYRKSL